MAQEWERDREQARERDSTAAKGGSGGPGGTGWDGAGGGGCLAAPVRWAVLILVVPVRAVWDVLVAAAKGLGAALLWLGEWLLVAPARWLYGHVLAPVGRGVVWLVRAAGAAVAWLWRWVVVAPVVWAWRWLIVAPVSLLHSYALKPLGIGVVWLARGLLTVVGWVLSTLLLPFVLLWRYVLAPAWAAAGRCTRWIWNATARPAGRAVRDAWRTARDAVAAARATARRTRMELRAALFGDRRIPAPDPLPEPLPVDAPAPAVDLAKHEPRPGGRHR